MKGDACGCHLFCLWPRYADLVLLIMLSCHLTNSVLDTDEVASCRGRNCTNHLDCLVF
jgi:hypothetical protein